MCDYKKNIFLAFFLIFGVIFVSQDSLFFATNSNQAFVFAKYFYAMGVTLAISLFYFFYNTKFHKSAFFYCNLMIIISLMNLIVQQDFSLGNFYRILMFPYALCITQIVKLDSFKYIFDSIMFVLCLISLFFYLLFLLYPSFFVFFPTIKNSLNIEFFSMGIYNTCTVLATRNFGFAREPGVFQAFIAIALLIQISNTYKPNYYKIFVYIATMFTTFSTTGFIAISVWFAIFSYERKIPQKRKYTFFLFLLLSIVCVFLFTNVSDLLDSTSVFSKLSKSNSYTTISRYSSVVTNLYICIQHPLFGVGIQRVVDLSQELNLAFWGINTDSNTNTIFYNFSTQGFLYGFLWAIPYALFSKQLFSQTIPLFLASLVLLIICFGELFCYSGIFYLLIFYSFSNENIIQNFHVNYNHNNIRG